MARAFQALAREVGDIERAIGVEPVVQRLEAHSQHSGSAGLVTSASLESGHDHRALHVGDARTYGDLNVFHGFHLQLVADATLKWLTVSVSFAVPTEQYRTTTA